MRHAAADWGRAAASSSRKTARASRARLGSGATGDSLARCGFSGATHAAPAARTRSARHDYTLPPAGPASRACGSALEPGVDAIAAVDAIGWLNRRRQGWGRSRVAFVTHGATAWPTTRPNRRGRPG